MKRNCDNCGYPFCTHPDVDQCDAWLPTVVDHDRLEADNARLREMLAYARRYVHYMPMDAETLQRHHQRLAEIDKALRGDTHA